MAGHEWFTLHFKSDNHVSENCVQGPAVHVGQMPNRLLLAASLSCPAYICYGRFERKTDINS